MGAYYVPGNKQVQKQPGQRSSAHRQAAALGAPMQGAQVLAAVVRWNPPGAGILEGLLCATQVFINLPRKFV